MGSTVALIKNDFFLCFKNVFDHFVANGVARQVLKKWHWLKSSFLFVIQNQLLIKQVVLNRRRLEVNFEKIWFFKNYFSLTCITLSTACVCVWHRLAFRMIEEIFNWNITVANWFISYTTANSSAANGCSTWPATSIGLHFSAQKIAILND